MSAECQEQDDAQGYSDESSTGEGHDDVLLLGCEPPGSLFAIITFHQCVELVQFHGRGGSPCTIPQLEGNREDGGD